MPTLAISAFAHACNETLRQLNLVEDESRNVTPRTVRFYTQEGLLPEPLFEGGRACYRYEHLLRVLAIKVYQSRFYPLRIIRKRLAGEGKFGLERLISDAVSSGSGEFPMHTSAFSTPSTSERPSRGLKEPYAMVPGIPPEVPVNPPEVPRAYVPSVPTVYERDSERVEYRVLVRGLLAEATLEGDLNTLGRDSWYLVQILVHEGQALLILMRRRPGRK